MIGKKGMKILRGIPASPGVADGEVHQLTSGEFKVPRYWINQNEVKGEVERLQAAVERSKEQLKSIRDKLCRFEGKEQIGVLDSHILMLEDQMLINNTVETIRKEKLNAEWAVKKNLDKIKGAFSHIDEDYYRERIKDVDYVCQRVIKNLTGQGEDTVGSIKGGVVVVAHDLSPANTAQMNKKHIRAFVTEVGGRTSHTAIIARSLEIPAVVGVDKLLEITADCECLIVDGSQGVVIINPDQETLKRYRRRKKSYEDEEKRLLENRDLPAETLDGLRISLAANIEMVEEVASAKEHGAEGIGLFRTEFLYINRDEFPDEEEHFECYKGILKEMAPHYVTIRTMDMGADKVPVNYRIKGEVNPALGLRAIRFCLKEEKLFRIQLRAMLRASKYGKLKILFPLISGLEELRRVRSILKSIEEELKKEGHQISEDYKIGIMIELPSAAVIADLLAREVDFFSIGTNDLIQYTLAVDRANENVAYLYEPFHPSILRLLKGVVDASKKRGIEVSVCGEMAGEPAYLMLLIGMGFSQLSMNSISIPRVKDIIRSSTHAQAKEVLDHILSLDNSNVIQRYLSKQVKRLCPKKLV